MRKSTIVSYDSFVACSQVGWLYNAELREICNYYGIASNFYKLGYLMEYSCLKTLAAKHKSSIFKIKAKFKDGKGRWGVPYETKAGRKRRYFVKYAECIVNDINFRLIYDYIVSASKYWISLGLKTP